MNMPDDVVLSVRNVSKKFCRNLRRSMLYGMQDLGRDLFGLRPKSSRPKSSKFLVHSSSLNHEPETRNQELLSQEPGTPNSEHARNSSLPPLRKDEFWALQNINFELRRGEVLGLIGPNGSGKTTLLRLFAGIFPPDAGEITIRGRVGALISLGAGFHPHMTGRENIYLNGAILGMAHDEIDAKFGEIVGFAEIGEFLDAPVATYSSGMRVRLGFAVATATQPDLLLIDEVLAVGDVGFQTKCFNILNKQLSRSAVVFVSHSMAQVARVAHEIIVMYQGGVKCRTRDVGVGIERYYDFFKSEQAALTGSGKAVIERMRVYKKESDPEQDIPAITYGEDLWIDMDYRLADEVSECSIALAIFDKSLRIVAQSISKASGKYFANPHGPMTLRIRVPRIPLVPGHYSLTVGFTSRPKPGDWGEHLARYEAVKSFKVTGVAALSSSNSPVVLEADWISGAQA